MEKEWNRLKNGWKDELIVWNKKGRERKAWKGREWETSTDRKKKKG